MKLRCTNRDTRVVVLSFVGTEGALLAGISLHPDDIDIDPKEGDEFRLVKVVKKAAKAKAKGKPAPPNQGGVKANLKKKR